ncbi:unnamed protein product [Orchesella dallaii]|uniref:Uncharacterized protein n=1 Tax=Orchesella dallaii TaxID=48710 RepID=A0ABP1Q817_9HEXA
MNGAMTDYETINHQEVMLSALSPLGKPVKVLVRERNKIGCPTPKMPIGPWIKELKKQNIKKKVKRGDGLYAVQTIFGWTLSGPVPKEKGNSSAVIQSYFCGELTNLWDLEAIGIRDMADKQSKMEQHSRVKHDEEEIMTEKKKTVASNFVQEENTLKYSRHKTNVRVAAWMRRFINNSRIKQMQKRDLFDIQSIEELSPLSPEEISLGERDLIYGVQRRHFGEKPSVKGFLVEKHEDGLWHLKT